MKFRLEQLLDTLAGYHMDAAIEGDVRAEIESVATIDDARPGQITFLSNPKYERKLGQTQATAVVLRPDVDAPKHLSLIRTADPYAAITALIVAVHGYRKHPPLPPGVGTPNIHPSARIGENASIHPGVTVAENVTIGKNAVIYPGCYVGPRSRIGDDVILYPNVVIYDDSVLGDRVALHAGTVIGEDGLGYAPIAGKWVKIPQIGHVELGDDVELGSNCSIDRATLGKTVIASGTKFSNLITIGHGTQIGEHCMFVAQAGVAGSVTIGDHVTMAGQVGVVGHIRVGDNATIAAKSGVTSDIPDGATVLGQPAIPIAEMRRQIVHAQRLPELRDTVKKLEKRIAELERRLESTQNA